MVSFELGEELRIYYERCFFVLSRAWDKENRGFRYNDSKPTFYRCFAEDAEKFTKISNARAQPLFYSLNLLFSDVPVPVVVFLNAPNICQRGHGTVSLPSVQAQPITWSSQSLKGTCLLGFFLYWKARSALSSVLCDKTKLERLKSHFESAFQTILFDGHVKKHGMLPFYKPP